MSRIQSPQVAPANPRPILTGQDEERQEAQDCLISLMDRYERGLYSYLLTLLRDPETARDCAQDAFMRAYEQLQRGKPVNGNWLYTVARNRAIDSFRARRRLEPQSDLLEQIAVQQHSIEGAVDVQDVLALLSPQDRELLYLYEIAGFNTEEIGAMVGVRGTAIRQRLSRARERFRRLYLAAP